MSERIEEQAVKWYDSVKYKSDLSGTPISGYIAGYEQAEKDTIERIIGYMGKCDLEHTILDFDENGYAYIDFERLEMLIRKAKIKEEGE